MYSKEIRNVNWKCKRQSHHSYDQSNHTLMKKITDKMIPPILREENCKLHTFCFDISHFYARNWKTIEKQILKQKNPNVSQFDLYFDSLCQI